MEKLKDELEREEMIIKEASARFAIFLRDNTLTPYNDCTEAYLKICMKNEEREVSTPLNSNLIQSWQLKLYFAFLINSSRDEPGGRNGTT